MTISANKITRQNVDDTGKKADKPEKRQDKPEKRQDGASRIMRVRAKKQEKTRKNYKKTGQKTVVLWTTGYRRSIRCRAVPAYAVA